MKQTVTLQRLFILKLPYRPYMTDLSDVRALSQLDLADSTLSSFIQP